MRDQHIFTFSLLGVLVLACERDPAAPAERRDALTVLEPSRDLPGDSSAAKPKDRERSAKATFAGAEGVDLKGEAQLQESGHGLRIDVEIRSAPLGLKGIHVHEKGDCSDIRGKSMGPHFSPGSEAHGLPEARTKHLGDLGNIKVDASGNGELEIVVPHANLKPGDTHSFLGRAIVIHTSQDVGTGDSGESGDPIACAIIEKD